MGGGKEQVLSRDSSRWKALFSRASCYEQLFEALMAPSLTQYLRKMCLSKGSQRISEAPCWGPTSALLLIWQSSCNFPCPCLILDSVPKVNVRHLLHCLPPSTLEPDWEAREECCAIHAACNSPGLAWLPHLGPGVACAGPVPGMHSLAYSCAWAAHLSALPTSDPMGKSGHLLSWNWRGQDLLRVCRPCIFSSLASSSCCLMSNPAGTVPMSTDACWPAPLSVVLVSSALTSCWNTWKRHGRYEAPPTLLSGCGDLGFLTLYIFFLYSKQNNF